MQTFDYTVKNKLGIHARPAGVLVKVATSLSSEVSIKKENGRPASLKSIFSIMGLGVKCGDKVIVSVKGTNEADDAKQLKEFFQKNF